MASPERCYLYRIPVVLFFLSMTTTLIGFSISVTPNDFNCDSGLYESIPEVCDKQKNDKPYTNWTNVDKSSLTSEETLDRLCRFFLRIENYTCGKNITSCENDFFNNSTGKLDEQLTSELLKNKGTFDDLCLNANEEVCAVCKVIFAAIRAISPTDTSPHPKSTTVSLEAPDNGNSMPSTKDAASTATAIDISKSSPNSNTFEKEGVDNGTKNNISKSQNTVIGDSDNKTTKTSVSSSGLAITPNLSDDKSNTGEIIKAEEGLELPPKDDSRDAFELAPKENQDDIDTGENAEYDNTKTNSDTDKEVTSKDFTSGPHGHALGTFSSGYSDDGDSHFFVYFLAVVGMCIVMYVLFHNKQKILAIIIEGRQDRRRRPNSNLYRKLDNNLEEIIQDRPKNGRSNTKIIY